jgi:hypothetical protein
MSAPKTVYIIKTEDDTTKRTIQFDNAHRAIKRLCSFAEYVDIEKSYIEHEGTTSKIYILTYNGFLSDKKCYEWDHHFPALTSDDEEKEKYMITDTDGENARFVSVDTVIYFLSELSHPRLDHRSIQTKRKSKNGGMIEIKYHFFTYNLWTP